MFRRTAPAPTFQTPHHHDAPYFVPNTAYMTPYYGAPQPAPIVTRDAFRPFPYSFNSERRSGVNDGDARHFWTQHEDLNVALHHILHHFTRTGITTRTHRIAAPTPGRRSFNLFVEAVPTWGPNLGTALRAALTGWRDYTVTVTLQHCDAPSIITPLLDATVRRHARSDRTQLMELRTMRTGYWGEDLFHCLRDLIRPQAQRDLKDDSGFARYQIPFLTLDDFIPPSETLSADAQGRRV